MGDPVKESIRVLPSTSEEALTVITYNIWNGFARGEGVEQRQQFISFIQEEQPDVLALEELCDFNGKKLKELANSYGHSYSAILKFWGYPVGITSTQPIKVKKRKFLGFWHGFLHVEINNIQYIVVHLSPEGAAYRKKESEKLISYIEKKVPKEAPLIILGDFNAYSMADKESMEGRTTLLERYQRSDQGRKEEKRYLYKDFFDFRILEAFEDAGFTDTLIRYNPNATGQWTFPTRALAGEDEEMLAERIDYQLASEYLADSIISAEIIRTPTTMEISDHYPYKVVYQLKGSQ